MHILLVQPRVNAEPSYPLALAAMIPLLEGAGHTVEGIDLTFDEESVLYSRLQSGEVDWVGATVLHHNSEGVARWMRPLAKQHGIRTFVAGALPTLDPLAALAHTGAEFAVVGPPEETVADLVDAKDPRTVLGVVHSERPIPEAQISRTIGVASPSGSTCVPRGTVQLRNAFDGDTLHAGVHLAWVPPSVSILSCSSAPTGSF